jgi:hypothetical protein
MAKIKTYFLFVNEGMIIPFEKINAIHSSKLEDNEVSDVFNVKDNIHRLTIKQEKYSC